MRNWSPKILRKRIVALAHPALGFFFVLVSVVSCGAEPKVTIRTAGAKKHVFNVEIADTPAKRQLGLQYRRELAQDRGMLFVFAAQQVQSFWMKDTPLPLDMIFINRERKIVGIVHEAVPFSLDSRSVASPSQFVLEINGGLARRLEINAGDQVEFEQVAVDSIKE